MNDQLQFRIATIYDLPRIVHMLVDDFLGTNREKINGELSNKYIRAFQEIEKDPNNELIVAVLSEPPAVAGLKLQKPAREQGRNRDVDSYVLSNGQASAFEPAAAASGSDIVGTFQLIYTPSLSFQGSKRCTVESVRVDSSLRGQGIGREMMLWAIERAKERGCVSMQLATHKDRTDAHRFYESLGFSKSHIGMKLKL